ncbi:rhodanese-like domain-containing protein [Pseudanabaena sp. FACHB-1998]|uniref:rhodanese-like domain-containing protein n=1 Tax=Pseudanabaena sp. FACHB-1998 TaxID=2692858 RepID=UPI001680783B|nr:rhodanese-like domain-containing protein [Pseudanabaena sp. FACHB-1998]MBD2179108.1 rhodanese-like domain-containing protein [Pseudanabaena sp. FACHB-1998]
MHKSLDRSPVHELDATSLKQKLELQQVTLIDVRESGEYSSERISGSISMPLSTFDPEQIAQISIKPIVLCCQSGMRSSKATQQLLEYGFESVGQLQGGLSSWKSAGFKTESDQNAPISLFRQIQIVAGSLVALGTLLGAFVSPYYLILSGFVGCGLVFAGVTNTCAMGMLLAKLPYNRAK